MPGEAAGSFPDRSGYRSQGGAEVELATVECECGACMRQHGHSSHQRLAASDNPGSRDVSVAFDATGDEAVVRRKSAALPMPVET